MTLTIRGKIIIISVVVIFFAMGATILVNSTVFTKEYSGVLKLKTFVVAQTLKAQLDRLLKLKIPISDLLGFDEQCQDVVAKYEEISYAMVVEIDGTILFHNDPSRHGQVLTNSTILEGIRNREETSQKYSSDGEQFYNITVPVFGIQNEHIAAVILGFRTDYIARKSKKMLVYSAEVALFFIFLAVMLLIILLNVWVSKPLKKLMMAIQNIRQKGTMPIGLAEVSSHDEIGHLSATFTQMMVELRDSHEKIQNYTQELELKVEKRTAELRATNAEQQRDILDRRRAEEALQRERDLARALENATAALTGTLDFEQVLDRILEQVSHVVPNDTTDIMLIEGDQTKIVRWRGYERFGMGEQISTLVFRVSETQNFQHMVNHRATALIPDVALDSGWVSLPGQEWLCSYAAAPIVVRDEVIGFLNVSSAIAGFFTQSHAEVLRAFAEHAAAAIENARLYEVARQELAERKRTEESLQQANQELKTTQAQLIQSGKLASIGELAAGVAHELNQPLMVIRTTAQLVQRSIQRGILNIEQLKEHLEPIERNTKRMMNIIDHLRTFSRQSQAEFTHQDINRIIEGAFLMVEEQLRLHDIKIQKHLTPSLPKIRGSAIQLEQVILNLLTNARDAIDANKKDIAKQIDIFTRVAGENNKYAEILVKDSGTGIAVEHLENIFDPFFSTKEVGKGTGLGLSISYGIIQDHQGDIEVTETGPEGTTFRIRLPGFIED